MEGHLPRGLAFFLPEDVLRLLEQHRAPFVLLRTEHLLDDFSRAAAWLKPGEKQCTPGHFREKSQRSPAPIK